MRLESQNGGVECVVRRGARERAGLSPGRHDDDAHLPERDKATLGVGAFVPARGFDVVAEAGWQGREGRDHQGRATDDNKMVD